MALHEGRSRKSEPTARLSSHNTRRLPSRACAGSASGMRAAGRGHPAPGRRGRCRIGAEHAWAARRADRRSRRRETRRSSAPQRQRGLGARPARRAVARLLLHRARSRRGASATRAVGSAGLPTTTITSIDALRRDFVEHGADRLGFLPGGNHQRRRAHTHGAYRMNGRSVRKVRKRWAVARQVRHHVRVRMTHSGVIRRFRTAAAAREALLVGRGRLAVDPSALPEAVRAGIQATFGEDLGADEVVQRILDDVRDPRRCGGAPLHAGVRSRRPRRPARARCRASTRPWSASARRS